MSVNTLFLRLEGPLQAWGDQESKFVIRRSAEAPTKSGVIGMLCAALGVSRSDAAAEWLPKLASLDMGVRIDRPGVRWWDYHTVGARMNMRIAEGDRKVKLGAMLTRREYLADASFLVAPARRSEPYCQTGYGNGKPPMAAVPGKKILPSVASSTGTSGGRFSRYACGTHIDPLASSAQKGLPT